ncbi:hypothetical protein D3C85_1462190 [compost metagenome]
MIAGMAMPPSAAMPGSTMRAAPRNWPSSTSRLISSPTSRKKIAIRPSLIQCSTVSLSRTGPAWKPSLAPRTSKYRGAAEVFATTRAASAANMRT